jgi:hypothetical protein
MSTNSEPIVPFHLSKAIDVTEALIFTFIGEIDNPLIPKLDNTLKPLTIAELKQQYLHEQMLARRSEYLVEDAIRLV